MCHFVFLFLPLTNYYVVFRMTVCGVHKQAWPVLKDTHVCGVFWTHLVVFELTSTNYHMHVQQANVFGCVHLFASVCVYLWLKCLFSALPVINIHQSLSAVCFQALYVT